MFFRQLKKTWVVFAAGALLFGLPHLAQASFSLKSELIDSSAAVGEDFGNSVSVDGDTAVVGIPGGVVSSVA